MRVHRHKHSIRIRAQMHQSDACAGPAHPTEQAQPLNPPPRPPQPNVDLLSPTCDADTRMDTLLGLGNLPLGFPDAARISLSQISQSHLPSHLPSM